MFSRRCSYRRARLLATVSVAVGVAPVAMTTSANGDQAQSQAVAQANSVFRAYGERLIPQGQLDVVHGTRTPTGECRSTVTLPTMHLGDGPKAAAEVEQDPGTCSETYRIGAPSERLGPLSPEATPNQAGKSSTATAEAQPSGTASRAVAREASRRQHSPRAHTASSYAKAYFLTVIKYNSNGVPQTQAWVQTTVQWHYDGICVVSPNPTGGASDWWVEPWGLGYQDFPNGWECARTWFARGFEIGNRYNSCGGGNAWIHVMRNTIDAYANGSFTPYDGDSWCDNQLPLYHLDYWNYY